MANNRETIKLIDKAYIALDVLNSQCMTNWRDKAFRIALVEERWHRRSNGGAYACPAIICAKMFVVRWIAQYLYTPKKKQPAIKDVLWMREDVILCAALAAEYSTQIREALRGLDMKAIAAVDYVQLVNGGAP